ncbi:MAG: ribosomal protein S18-alanine N-acetyltransferase [Microcoleaceae cyanobacterium MO_207.B10]|nr:ribosomal protein S18-alanine N-acetyltransferase [Microcoleaceae cyanobacterium MO_207.B10]
MAIITVKPMSSEDISAVVELDKICFSGLWSAEGYRRELESPNSDLLVLLWESIHSETPSTLFSSVCHNLPIVGVGCLWAILEEAHITILGIHPNYQRQGLGQLLLYALMKSAWERGLERATLEVAVSNSSALSLYHKFGFKSVGSRRGYYQKTGEDALIMWRGNLHEPEFQETLAEWYEMCNLRRKNHTFKLFF